MEKRAFSALAVGTGLAVGIIGTVMFYGKLIGISFLLFTLVAVAALFLLARPADRKIQRRNLWPFIPLLLFAGMVAVRTDPLVTFLNVLAVLALGGLVLHYLALSRPLDEESFAEQLGGVVAVSIVILPFGLNALFESWGWLRERRHKPGGQLVSAMRCVVFALPILAVFGFLLGSADAVFASYMTQAWDGVRRVLGLQVSADTIGTLFTTFSLALLATGGLTYALSRRLPVVPEVASPADEEIDSDETESSDGEFNYKQAIINAAGREIEKRKPAFKLSMIESTIVLGSVVLLFAAFVVVQFAYFFGGTANISIEGLTYAQYARRGFFELVAVSTLTLGLALMLDRVTTRQPGRENILFRSLSVALAGLTTVMLVSAAQRMWLYEESYGFTQLRVYTHVAMIWLGVMFDVFVLALFRVHKNVFSLGVLLTLIGYLGTLNVMNVDLYIAERNLARHTENEELDIAFLNILSVDASPAILDFYLNKAEPGTEAYQWAGQWLARQLQRLEDAQAGYASTIFSFNLSRQSALADLQLHAREIPPYDPSLYWGSYGWLDEGYGRGDYSSGWEYTTPSR